MPSDSILRNIPEHALENFLPGFGLARSIVLRNTRGRVDLQVILGFAFLAASLSGTIRYAWQKSAGFYEQIRRWLVSSVTISGHEELGRDFIAWMNSASSSRSSRHLNAHKKDGSQSAQKRVSYATDTRDYSMFGSGHRSTAVPAGTNSGSLDDTSPAIEYAPAQGTHWVFHNWTLFMIRDEGEKVNVEKPYDQMTGGSGLFGGQPSLAPWFVTSRTHNLEISVFGWSTTPIQNLLTEINKFAAERAKKERTTSLYMLSQVGEATWGDPITRPARPLSTVDLDEQEKSGLVEDTVQYLGGRSFYARRGIPYRRGYLFYGPPGTGKTSLSAALAGEFQLNLYMLSISSDGLDDEGLASLFAQLPSRCIIMLEDVDAVRIAEQRQDPEPRLEQDSNEQKVQMPPTREDSTFGGGAMLDDIYGVKRRMKRKDKFRGVTLSGLLNVIDGITAAEGRILIMTANHPETLDKALIRPGRIDRQVHLGYISKQNAKQIFIRMYTKDEDEALVASAITEKLGAPSGLPARAQSPGITPTSPSLRATVPCGPPGAPRPDLTVRSPRPYTPSVPSPLAQALASPVPLPKRTVSLDIQKDVGDIDNLNYMATLFAVSIPEGQLTPAEVQGFLLERRNKPWDAVTEVVEWVADKRRQREQGTNIVKLQKPPPADAKKLERGGAVAAAASDVFAAKQKNKDGKAKARFAGLKKSPGLNGTSRFLFGTRTMDEEDAHQADAESDDEAPADGAGGVEFARTKPELEELYGDQSPH